MNMCESVFDRNGNRIGEIVMHSETGAVGFKPAEGREVPPCGLYKNLDDLKRDLVALYGDLGKLQRHGSG